MPKFQAPKGTQDILPPESARWEELVARFAGLADRAGYGLIVSPMFEELGVFSRVGESTDIVRKEMYDFEDKGGRRVALRPEGTASVVRAYVQHRPTPPWKTWYVAPSFRYERAQAGRYRQHHQLGVEALGSDDPDLDVEVIALAWSLYREVGLTRVRLRLNSLGDDVCRPAYRELLLRYFGEHRGELCDEHRDGYLVNPMRVFDCKQASCMAVSDGAPRMADHLCDACAAHFERVRSGLTSLDVPFHLDDRLVRGLDYYTRTTFEFAGEALESAQNGVGGGGRYDGLAEALGGPPTPGIGFGLGIERILLACDAEGVFPAPQGSVDVFVVDMTGGALAWADRLRRAGLRADRSFGGRSMRAQMKEADRSGARFAVVIGEHEQAHGVATVRDLRSDGTQDEVAVDDVVSHLQKRLSS